MDQIIAYMNTHPLLWLAVAALVALTLLRIIAKLACLAVCLIGGAIVVSFALALLKGLA